MSISALLPPVTPPSASSSPVCFLTSLCVSYVPLSLSQLSLALLGWSSLEINRPENHINQKEKYIYIEHAHGPLNLVFRVTTCSSPEGQTCTWIYSRNTHTLCSEPQVLLQLLSTSYPRFHYGIAGVQCVNTLLYFCEQLGSGF